MTDSSIIEQYHTRRQVWANKPHIRLVYERWMTKISPFLPQGRLLETGSGSGLLSDLIPGVILTDIVYLPWLDLVADCLSLPLQSSTIDGILVFDMLHHAPDPHAFLRESARVLKTGGRMLLIEPYISPLSYLGYRTLHHEDVFFGDYHKKAADGKQRDPWNGNLALPNLVFDRDSPKWNELQPELRCIHRERFSLVDFQLSAGFQPKAFVPFGIFKTVVRLDDYLSWLMPFVAFRIFVVLEKTTS